ncbi:prolyl oligopeptidase [Scenedesmus sp. NREL 46B-D3]|nr:prolyl oligopeptidase [Scenedesmus sp. NREL 46B-D3]
MLRRYQGYYYYTRTEEGQQYSVHCRRAVAPGAGPPAESDQPGEGGAEEVLLDENRRKEEGKHSFYMVGCCEPSPNQRLLAWTEDTVGGEKYTLHVKDLATGKELMDPIRNTSGDVVWASDNATLFYIVKDHLDRPYKVLRHKVGSSRAGAEDPVVYEEKDESFYVGMERSHSEQMLFVHAGSAVTSETLFMPADTPEGTFKVVLPRTQDVEYSISHHPGSSSSQGWFLITIRDPALPNSELRVAPVTDPTRQTVILPHSGDVKIEGASVGARWLVVSKRSRAQQSMVLHRLPADGGMLRQLGEGQVVQFDEAAYALSGGLTGNFDSEVLRLRYSSLTTPPSVYDQHMETGKRALKKVQPILGGFNKEEYVTQRLWTKASDGTEVPISLAYRKDMAKRDGTDPLLLHGYGSYEYAYDPSFNRDQLSLLDRGWTVAIAHIRGGGDMGRMWYEDGKYLKKRNTFTDFIACAEHLIKERYTSPSRLAIEGRSAGGLLMGAVTNMRPDLFNAVMMGVPFVDALTTMLDETIPLTTIEWEEWGNPQEQQYYEYMKSYSPVDNVKAQDYPHILVTAGLHDPRVGYWEPAKLVAKLRELKTNKRMLLFKCELGAGHFSVTGRFERLKETAFEFAFLLKTAGMLRVKLQPGSSQVVAAS